MKAQRFGSAHTEKKLRLVAHYLERFATALKNQPFKKLYVDAFAGTGAWQSKDSEQDRQTSFLDIDEVAEGSARRALRVDPPFDRFVFIEKSARKASALRRLGSEFPKLAPRIEIVAKDANAALRELCHGTDWRRTRAVVFLDPFGFQVEWRTVEALAHTEAVDLWYLVPTGIGINRQISKDGRILKEGGELIDIMLGSSEWRSVFVKTETAPADLFGEIQIRGVKSGGIDEIADFMLGRLKAIFKGGVARYGLPLGPRGRALYTLVFACANPSTKASTLALRLADAVLKS